MYSYIDIYSICICRASSNCMLKTFEPHIRVYTLYSPDHSRQWLEPFRKSRFKMKLRICYYTYNSSVCHFGLRALLSGSIREARYIDYPQGLIAVWHQTDHSLKSATHTEQRQFGFDCNQIRQRRRSRHPVNVLE